MMQYQQNCVENEYYQCIWGLTLLPSSSLTEKKKRKVLLSFQSLRKIEVHRILTGC